MDSLNPGHQALRQGRRSIPAQIYVVTAVTARRRMIFERFDAAHAAILGFRHPTVLRDSRLLCWVLMPDHLHAVIELGPLDTLGGLLQRMKSAASRNVRGLMDPQQVWSKAFHHRALRRDEDLRAVARYVIANPLRAGLVGRVADYPFWDAAWLGEDRSLI